MLLRAPLGMRVGFFPPRLQHYQDYHAVTVRAMQREASLGATRTVPHWGCGLAAGC